MTTPRRLPSQAVIRAHWAPYLVALGKFDSLTEALEPDLCFACGFNEGSERAHIVARCDGGSDTVDNLHMLCSACHKTSECLVSGPYWTWLATRTFIDCALQEVANHGVNLSQLLKFAYAPPVKLEVTPCSTPSPS